MSLNYNKKVLPRAISFVKRQLARRRGKRDSFLCHQCYYRKSSPLGVAVSQTLRNDGGLCWKRAAGEDPTASDRCSGVHGLCRRTARVCEQGAVGARPALRSALSRLLSRSRSRGEASQPARRACEGEVLADATAGVGARSLRPGSPWGSALTLPSRRSRTREL